MENRHVCSIMVDLISLIIKNISTLSTIRREVDIEKCLIKAPEPKNSISIQEYLKMERSLG
jgi:hypothetical protein